MNEAGNNIVLEPKRNTLSEIYSYIIDDLKYAADNLNTTPYGNNRARVSKNRYGTFGSCLHTRSRPGVE